MRWRLSLIHICVVVADSRFPRDGRFIEEIGTYDPNQEPSVVSIDGEKAKAWIANGAQPVSYTHLYSSSKASADMFVMAFHDTYGMPVNITRCRCV